VKFSHLNDIGNFQTLLAQKQNLNESSILGKFINTWAGECRHIFFRGSNRPLFESKLKFPFNNMPYGSERGRQSQLWKFFTT
jgi:hypothetical protein